MGAQAICIMPSPYGPECATQMKWTCDLEKKYKDISFDKINIASSVKRDLSSIDISKILTMTPYTLVMSEGWERFICGIKNSPQCYQEIEEKKVYVVNTDAKHIPHLTKYEYENLGLRIVDAPLTNPIQKPQCSKTINTKHIGDDAFAPCNSGKIYRNCQESFTLSGEPFIFTNLKRKDHGNTKKQTFPRGSILYILGPKTLTAAANYPAVMHIPEGSNIRYIGSKNNETIFIINNSMSGTLKGGAGKENTLVMNVKANNIAANLHSGTIRYGNSNNIRLVNTYNYVSNSDNKQNITTHCETRLINVKNAEVWQNSSNCTDKDYEVRVVNKENVHHRGLKQTIFIVNEDSDNARIISDLGSTGKMKGNIDVIRVQVANITQWGVSKDTEKDSYSLDLLANDTQSIVSSTTIDDFKNLVIQVNCQGITESVTIQDKSLSDTIEDIRYQKLRNSGSDTDREIIQNSEKKLKAFIQASILDQELLDTYQIAKGIADDNNFDIPISQIEVTKNHMGIPAEKVIIAGIYSDQVIVDFSYNNSDVTQKYRNNGRSYDYDHYMTLCNYYQDATVEGGEGQHQYIIKLPDTLNHEISSFPIRLNLKIKSKAVPYQNIPYNIIDFAELNVTDVDSISIQEGKRSYINECYNQSISDLTEDSLEIKDITVLGSEGTKWSLSIGLVDYFQSPEHQQIVLRMNNELYKIDSTNLRLEHVEMNPNSFRYYQPEEQGLQIYHNQPISKNDIGLVDFRDKSVLGFDMEIADGSLVLSYGNSTIAKVENWSNYQPAREMMFAFNDRMVSNPKCIVSVCNSEDIIEDFNKEKVNLLKEQVFSAIVQSDISEAEDLTRKIETIDIEGKRLTPLYIAIQKGRLDIVEILFDRKHFSVKDKDIYGCNPLHWTAQQGNLNIAKFLVDKGADIGAKDNDGRTPLHVAAYSGDLDMVKFFLDKNASIEAKSSDPYKMMGVVEGVKNEIINQADTAPNVKRWAEFFVEKLRYSIKSVAKEKLKDGMLHNRYSSVNELANEIYKSDGKLFDDIIKGVINDVYGRVDTKETLSYVRSHNNAGQRISGYVVVFDAMQRNDDLNNSAIFKLAYYVKEVMEMKNYSDVHQEDRSNLEKLKSRLPESVRNAVFSSKVCIKNVYQGEYLYAANGCFDDYGDKRRMVFTWIPKDEKNDKFRWKIKPDGDNFYIVNVAFNETLYAASNYFNYNDDRRMVFTWIPGGRVVRDVWMIKPDGNSCSIMNVELNEYLYAADYAKYDNDRRRVFTWIPGGQVSQGMWMIEDCGSTLRKVRNADASSNLIVSRQVQLDYALLNATKIGNISEVTGLVNQGANVNTEDRDSNIPARNAVLKGYFGIIKYLVEKGVSLKAEDHYCGHPTCNAAYSGHLNILKYLISKCVDINDTDKNGWTPLHFAAWRGYLEVANFLIEKGADINAENIFGRKPIHIAAENNNKDIIDFFLSKGMSIDDTGRDGRTLLYLASRNGHLDLVRYLVDKVADVYTQDKGGKTLLDIATDQKHNNIVEYLKRVQLDKELLIAAQYGNLSKVEDLVSQRASLSAKYSDGRTLMHCAAYGGELNVVKYLVVGEKSSLKIKDNSGRIPLHYAAYNGKLDIVKYFIDEEKIDVNIKDHGGWAPLYYASCGGYSNVINYLGKIHNSDLISNLQENSTSLEIPNSNNIEVQDELGRTPLHLPAKAGDLSKINLLCDDYNANIEAQDNFGYTPIFFATQSGKLNVVSLVLYYGANINAQDMYGSTPLHYAAQEGNLGMIQLLLSRCARIELLDRNGWTPILFAARESKWNAVELLVSKGAKFNNEITYQGTPLHFAVRVNRLDIVKFLLDKHANIEARDMDGDVPLELAIQSGYKDIEEVLRQAQLDLDKELLNAAKSGDLDKVKECIKRGAYINTKSSNGRTSLHWAAFEGCLPGVEYLIKEVDDINAKDNTSRTPLHYAARNGHLDVVKYLIEEGADFEVKDKDDKTPLDLASWKKHNDVVKYLEKIKEERDKTVQRKRRHHHGDHARHHMSRKPLAIDSSNQPEIAASSSTRTSSWINDLFSWVKSSVGGLLSSRTALPMETSSTPSPVSQVDAQIDVNGTIILLDVLVRKVTGQKYISTVDQPISPLEAQGYVLNITKGFEKVVEQAGLKSGVSMHRLNIDFVEIQKEVTGKIMSGKFDEISGILNSYLEEACPGREAGCPGKLSPKKFDKFIAQFNKGLLNQSIEQILHNRDGRLEVDDAKQMSLEPQSYLSNASVHSNSEVSTCLSEIGVTKLGGNINR